MLLEMVPPGSLFLTQIPILIFLDRLSEFSNFLKNIGTIFGKCVFGKSEVTLRKVFFFVEETLAKWSF